MYGVAAVRRRTGVAGTPEWVPENATAHLDFVNGQYYAAGSTWAVTSLLGGGFDSGAISASGMAVQYSNANRPKAIGAFFSVLADNLATGLTFVFEVDTATEEIGSSPLLVFMDTADPDTAAWMIQTELRAEASAFDFNAEDFDALDLWGSIAGWSHTGVRRIGVTLSRPIGGGQYRNAFSGNGDTAQTQDLAYDGAAGFGTGGVAEIRVGAVDEWEWAWASTHIRSITVYPAQDEAELAALTAIPTA